MYAVRNNHGIRYQYNIITRLIATLTTQNYNNSQNQQAESVIDSRNTLKETLCYHGTDLIICLKLGTL